MSPERPICPRAEAINEQSLAARSHTYLDPTCPEECTGPVTQRLSGVLSVVYPSDFTKKVCGNPNATHQIVDIDIF